MESGRSSSSDGERLRMKEIGKTKKFWLNLRCALPDLDKCCCCLPLRLGFLTLAYIKLVISVLLLLFMLYFIVMVYLIFSPHNRIGQILLWTDICVDFLDIAFGIVMIVSAHKKSVKYMELYYKCSIFVFLLLTTLFAVIIHIIVDHMIFLLIILSIFFLILLLQIYIIILVRSEVRKLRSNAQFQFLNNEAEPQCTYTNDGSI